MRFKGTKTMSVSNYEDVEVVFLYDFGNVEITKVLWSEINILPLLEDWGKDLIFDLKLKIEKEYEKD
jgi:hypothetical protein